MTALKLGSFDPSLADRSGGHLSILALLPTLSPYGGVVSVVNAMNQMTLDGHRVKLLSLSSNQIDQVHPYSEPIHLPEGRPIRSLLTEHFDIALATSWHTVDPVVELAAASPNTVPWYFVQDFEVNFYPETDTKTRHEVMQTYRKIERKMVKTRYLSDVLQEQGFASEKIPPGMNLDIFYPRDVANDGTPSVLAMARPDTPDDHRGYDTLCALFKKIHAARPDVRLSVFGTDVAPDMPAAVEALGLRSPESLPAMYSKATVFVDTSRTHGFGRTGVEALACGTALVVTESGGVTEYARHGENCLVVPVDDVDALTEATFELIDNDRIRREFRQAGLATVGGMSDRLAADRMVDLFRTGLRRNRTRSNADLEP